MGDSPVEGSSFPEESTDYRQSVGLVVGIALVSIDLIPTEVQVELWV